MRVTIQLNETERIHVCSFCKEFDIFKLCKVYINEQYKPILLESSNMTQEEQKQADSLIDKMQSYWESLQVQLSLNFGE